MGQYSKTLQKIVYPGNRSCLRLDDVQRTNCSSYPSQAVDINTPSEIKTVKFVDKANEFDAATDAAERKRLLQKKGTKVLTLYDVLLHIIVS